MSVHPIGVVPGNLEVGAMEPYADASCVLKVNVCCEACKMKMVEVLSSIIGVYSVEVDAREGLAKVYGEVDPNILLMAIARSGKHAEVAWIRLKHPVLNNDYHNSSCYGRYTRRGPSWYDRNGYCHLGQQPFYPRRRTMADHQHPCHCHQCHGNHGCGGFGPYAYPPRMYCCADDDTAPYCNVM